MQILAQLVEAKMATERAAREAQEEIAERKRLAEIIEMKTAFATMLRKNLGEEFYAMLVHEAQAQITFQEPMQPMLELNWHEVRLRLLAGGVQQIQLKRKRFPHEDDFDEWMHLNWFHPADEDLRDHILLALGHGREESRDQNGRF